MFSIVARVVLAVVGACSGCPTTFTIRSARTQAILAWFPLKALLACILFAIPQVAWAQVLKVANSQTGELSDRTVYLLRYRCLATENPIRIQRGRTETFGFVIDAHPRGGTTPSLGDTAASVVWKVYDFAPGTQFTGFDCGGAKGGTYFLSGADNPRFTAIYLVSDEARIAFLTAAATFVTSSLNPLKTLLPAEFQAPLQAGATLATNLGTFLRAVSPNQDRIQSIAIVPGHISVGAPHARVEIDVVEVPRLLNTPDVPFRKSLEQIGAITPDYSKVLADSAALRSACGGVEDKWNARGVRAPEDIAYVLAQSFGDATPSTANLVQCLGRTNALAALDFMKLFPARRTFSRADIEEWAPDRVNHPIYGDQPPRWSMIAETLRTFVEDLNRVADGVSLPQEEVRHFTSLFGPSLAVEDMSFRYDFIKALTGSTASTTVAGKPDDIVGKLVAAGFVHWECLVSTNDHAVKSSLNESAALIVKRRTVAGEVSVYVRVFFDQESKIRALVLDDADNEATLRASCAA